MKNNLKATASVLMMAICILSGLSGVSAYAQTADGDEYKPMVEEGYEWGYFHGTVGDPTYHYEDFYYRLQFLGDSIVDGKTYKKLYMYQTDKLNPDLQWPIALMREENKQVFMYPPDYIFNPQNSKYQEGWDFLEPAFMSYFCMDNLIYDFNAETGSPFININYSDWWINEDLIHVGHAEYSIGSERVYYSINANYVSDEDTKAEIIERADKTILGIGILSRNQRNGIISFPIAQPPLSTIQSVHFLLYKRKLDGTMVFVNDENAKYMADDPTLKTHSVDNLTADGGDGVWIEVGTLRGDGLCTVSSLSGVMLYSGVAEGYRFPASGIYLIKTDTRVLKAAVAI